MEFKDDAHELAHLYVDGAFNRRELVRRAKQVVGGFAAVTAAMQTMGIPANAQQGCSLSDLTVPADAPDLVVQDIQFAGPASTLFAHYVKPKRESNDPIPAVLVIHENRGLTEHIKDVTRRVARGGFIALGIDLISRQGGTDKFPDPADAGRAYNMTTTEGRLADLQASVAYLRSQPDVRPNSIGSVGFCAGGGNVWALAVSGEAIAANVIYYGSPVPAAAQIANIKGAVMCHYAELDRNLTGQSGGALTALATGQKRFTFNVWEGVGHAFNNDTGAAFNASAACDAWTRTIGFFLTKLYT
ncbi:MAG: dienelactone hydrolase family protein [Candidatus Solibacter usitatus]|nr:dienelactone hydrolase family protein [Candidatus Solibacter usitatus]